MARSRRACPERSRGNPDDACWPMLSRAFRPQNLKEIKKSQPPSEAEGSAVRPSLSQLPTQKDALSCARSSHTALRPEEPQRAVTDGPAATLERAAAA
jgi:hypothetical protein